MKLLLVVGTAKDVFIYNMAKWLKSSMNVSIDVFEFYPSNRQNYDYRYYDSVTTVGKPWYTKIKGLRNIITPFYNAKCLDNFIKEKYYDIIQCHWIVPSVVLSKNLKPHCKKLYVSFWGGELSQSKICYSNKLYRYKLNHFINDIDYILNSETYFNLLAVNLPEIANKLIPARLGSAALDYLYNLMSNKDRSEIKAQWDIPTDKFSVLIGYSGKPLHQHLKIINALKQNNYLKDKIHLLAIMTRGYDNNYTEQTETALYNCGYSYTMVKGRFLSDEEIASFRYATDIVLQLSIFDAFSRSIVECLCAGSIVLYGKWLDNYPESLNNDGFQAIAVNSIESACGELKNIVDHCSSFSTMLQNNTKAGRKNTWSECIKDWIEAYQR